MSLQLTAWNNEPFLWVQDLTNWAALYPLASSAFEMQFRPDPASPFVTLAFAEQPTAIALGTISFDPASNAMTASAPQSVVQNLGGSYSFDFGFIPPGGDFIRIDGGTVIFNQGVTR